MLFCLFIFFFFIHYCSVDSSHPSSHPPPATDGAAGANATDNANASLVNGTSQPPACLIWWISLLTVSNSLSPRWPAQMLCLCDCTLRDPAPHTLQELGRAATGMLQLHPPRIQPGRGRVWNCDLLAIQAAVKRSSYVRPVSKLSGRFTWCFIIKFHFSAWIWRRAPWERDSLCFSSFSLIILTQFWERAVIRDLLHFNQHRVRSNFCCFQHLFQEEPKVLWYLCEPSVTFSWACLCKLNPKQTIPAASFDSVPGQIPDPAC